MEDEEEEEEEEKEKENEVEEEEDGCLSLGELQKILGTSRDFDERAEIWEVSGGTNATASLTTTASLAAAVATTQATTRTYFVQ